MHVRTRTCVQRIAFFFFCELSAPLLPFLLCVAHASSVVVSSLLIKAIVCVCVGGAAAAVARARLRVCY